MAQNQSREYSCKDEELPAVCKFTAFSLKRDLSEFTAFSPKFTQAYVSDFETSIAAAMDMVEPKSETLEIKTINKNQAETMDGLLQSLDYLLGYIGLAKLSPAITASNFGITALRKALNNRDAEGVVDGLRVVSSNIDKFKTELMAQGFTDESVLRFKEAAIEIDRAKQRQYEIKRNRKALVEDNMSLLNNLYGKLMEILSIGKALYKKTDAVKLQEYSFEQLMKNVRRVAKPVANKDKPLEIAQ